MTVRILVRESPALEVSTMNTESMARPDASSVPVRATTMTQSALSMPVM